MSDITPASDEYKNGYIDALDWVIKTIFEEHHHFPEPLPDFAKEAADFAASDGEPYVFSLELESEIRQERDRVWGTKYPLKEWWEGEPTTRWTDIKNKKGE